MVFIAEYDNKPIDVSEITSKNKIKYKCLDVNCNNELIFRSAHNRKIKSNDIYIEISVIAHFAHIYKTDNCNIENFLNSLGKDIDRKFYRKWTEPFTYNAIKNTFNNEYKFHVLYEDIMIMTSNKINTKEIITNKENKCVNNEKITWILNYEDRYELNKNIIKRNYYDNDNIKTEYYLISNNSYYDLELYNMDKSNVYLDFGLNKLVKLVKKTFQGWIVELISIKNFLMTFNKILKETYVIPPYEKIKVIEHNIHMEIYDRLLQDESDMNYALERFKKELKSVSHNKNKKIHEEYIRLKKEFGIDYCENIQDKIFQTKISYYSYDCLCFIWDINNDNFDKYYSKNISCVSCLETISIQDLFNNNKTCVVCEKKHRIKQEEEQQLIKNRLEQELIKIKQEQELLESLGLIGLKKPKQSNSILSSYKIDEIKCFKCKIIIYTNDYRRFKNICCINCNLSDDHNKYILINNNFYILNKIKEYNKETNKHKWVQCYTYYNCNYCKNI